MIEITGTEKQIAWANDIRAKFIAEADKETRRLEKDIAGCIEDGDVKGEAWTREKLEKHTRLTAGVLSEVSRAGWWINYGRGDVYFVKSNYDKAKRGVALGGENRIK